MTDPLCTLGAHVSNEAKLSYAGGWGGIPFGFYLLGQQMLWEQSPGGTHPSQFSIFGLRQLPRSSSSGRHRNYLRWREAFVVLWAHFDGDLFVAGSFQGLGEVDDAHIRVAVGFEVVVLHGQVADHRP